MDINKLIENTPIADKRVRLGKMATERGCSDLVVIAMSEELQKDINQVMREQFSKRVVA